LQLSAEEFLLGRVQSVELSRDRLIRVGN